MLAAALHAAMLMAELHAAVLLEAELTLRCRRLSYRRRWRQSRTKW
jgi:hypothetical protein